MSLKVLAVVLALMTSYNNVPEQTDQTPNITAFQEKVERCSAAVSRDLEFQMGIVKDSVLCIPILELWGCNYELKVKDRLNIRKENQFDYFTFSNEESVLFGRKYNIEVLVLKKGSSCPIRREVIKNLYNIYMHGGGL